MEIKKGIGVSPGVVTSAVIVLDAEDSVAQAQTAVNVSVVAIYKSLGGVGQPLSNATAKLAVAP